MFSDVSAATRIRRRGPRHMKPGTLVIFSIATVLKLAPLAWAAGADTNCVTAESIVRDLKYSDRDTKSAYLLAFSVQVDGRSLHVESVLVAIEFTTKEWRLVHAYRHPRLKAARALVWREMATLHTASMGPREFHGTPKEADVDQFLRDSRWEFRPIKGFRLLRGEVYRDTWKRALGYEPKYEFPKPVS